MGLKRGGCLYIHTHMFTCIYVCVHVHVIIYNVDNFTCELVPAEFKFGQVR